MSPDDDKLPTEPGSVIGYSTYYDGYHYNVAVLSQGDDETGELAWWLAGFGDPRSPAVFEQQMVTTSWEYLGKVEASGFGPASASAGGAS